MIPVPRNLCRTAVAALVTLASGTRLAAQIPFEETLILSSDGSAGDRFGARVATARNVTAVRQIDWDNRQTEIGKVYVLEGCDPAQESQLQGTGLVPADMFGMSVATDGRVIVVGAPQTDSLAQDGVGGPGMVYVFRRNASGWQEEAILAPGSGGPDDGFGWSVAVDGDRIAVGAPGTNAYEGVVYAFRFDGTQWTEEAQLAWGNASGRYSGLAVAVSGDTVVSGVPYEAPWWAPHAKIGRIVACRKIGGVWEQFQIHSPNGRSFGRMGAAVAADGDRVVAGAPGGLGDGLVGEAFVFEFDGSDFQHTGTLAPSDGAVEDFFGNSVAIAGDLIAVGSPWNDRKRGAVYVEHFDGTSWSEDQKLTASDAVDGDLLGASTSMFSGRIVTGTQDNDDLGQESGAVYVFDAPMFLPYGEGLVGSGGYLPTLGATGIAQTGSTITVESRDFVGGAVSVMFVGVAKASTPVFGGTLLVDFRGGLILVMRLRGGLGVPGDGWSDLTATVPPEVGCNSVYLQHWAFDPGAVSNVSMTNGLEIYFTD